MWRSMQDGEGKRIYTNLRVSIISVRPPSDTNAYFLGMITEQMGPRAAVKEAEEWIQQDWAEILFFLAKRGRYVDPTSELL